MNYTTEERIEFAKTRDVGQVISTAFKLIRVHLKTLLSGVALFALPFYIVGAVLIYMAFDNMLALLGPLGRNSGADASLGMMFFGLMVMGLGTVMLVTFINECIKYVANHPQGPKPTIAILWKHTIRYFWWNILHFILWIFVVMMLTASLYLLFFVFVALIAGGLASGSTVLAAIFIMIAVAGALLLFLYIISTTASMFFIASYEEINIFTAMSRSMGLLHARKANFWGSIFSNLVAGITATIVSSSMLVPLYIVIGVITFLTGTTDLENSQTYKILLIVITAISTLIRPFVYIIPFAVVAVKYFDMTERVDGRGLTSRIERIGQTEDFDAKSYEDPY